MRASEIFVLSIAVCLQKGASSIVAASLPECQQMPLLLVDGSMVEIPLPKQQVHYTCNPGYRLEGPKVQTCINGTWSPEGPPSCVRDETNDAALLGCGVSPAVMHGHVDYGTEGSSLPRPVGSVATIVCNSGYSDDNFQTSYTITCGRHGLWTLTGGSVQLPACTHKHCTAPPNVPNALYNFNSYEPPMSEGRVIEYICNSGYVLLDPANAHLVCHNGQWDGPIPTCVHKAACAPPRYVDNGKWVLISSRKQFSQEGDSIDSMYLKYEVGSRIKYSCMAGYKLEGPQVLECEPSQLWSRLPPTCIPESEQIWYCPDLAQVKNGFCKCDGEEAADLERCMPFHLGTQIECNCLSGYTLHGTQFLTCIHKASLGMGVWDGQLPRCYKKYDPDMDVSGFDSNTDMQGKSYNSGDIRDNKTKVSSLVIVVTTACSVLGVLLLVMVIVVFRRKKPRAHLFQQGATPPPYARVHNNSVDEHDRMALMAYADASRIHLPSYEEAMRPGAGHLGMPGMSGPHNTSPTTSDYCRLPNIHPNVRAANLQHQQNIGGDGNNNINNNNNNNSNRHSVVTTSTMNRDGVSEIFGSLDTVNVSMSDASTSVTVETFDSGTSNRSIASQRATAGSLASSDDHLANDDAPLLEPSSQVETDGVSVNSDPSRSSKEE